MILIYITCKDKREAKKIASYLIKKRMAVCCNIFPIDSIYPVRNRGKNFQKIEDKHLARLDKISNEVYWQNNKIVKDRETVLIVKTLKKKFTMIEKEVKKLHSYNVPCIMEISVGKVNSEYLQWLNKEL